MKKWLSFLSIILVLTSCSKSGEDSSLNTAAATEIRNVSYGDNALQNMDVFLPAARTTTTTNCVIVIHGGSWHSGDKFDMEGAIIAMKPRLPDYAIFNINYRLANRTSITYTQQIEDVNNAVNYIISKANDYKININKFIIVGASAGAHLGMMKAYNHNSDGRVKAMVDFFGPTDLTWMYRHHPFLALTQSTLFNLFGATEPDNPNAYHAASPVNFITANSPSTLIFHGTADPIVPVSESDNLEVKLKSEGISHNYVKYPGQGHGDWNIATYNDAYDKTAAFIKTYVP